MLAAAVVALNWWFGSLALSFAAPPTGQHTAERVCGRATAAARATAAVRVSAQPRGQRATHDAVVHGKPAPG